MSVVCDNCKQVQPDGINFCDRCNMPLAKNRLGMPSPPPQFHTQVLPPLQPNGPPTERQPLVTNEWPQNSQYNRTMLVPEPLPTGWPPADAPAPSPAFVGTGPKMKLVVTAGKEVGQEFVLLAGESEIGRRDEDNNFHPHIDLDAQDAHGYIHRSHAFVLYENGGWFVEDGGKPNGTCLRRNRQVTKLGRGEKVPLQLGDEIIVGEIHLSFKPV